MPTLFKRSNGVYYALLPGPNGRRKWLSTRCRSKPEALGRLNELADRSPKFSSQIRLRQFRTELLEFVRSTFALETVSVYARGLDQLLKLVGDCGLPSITGRSVDLYKTSRARAIGGVTLNIELRTLRAAFNIALRWGYIQQNPFRQVKLARIDDIPPAILSKDDFRKIISGIPDDWFRKAIVIAGLSGLRRGELTNLRWSEVDLESGILKIQSHGEYRTKQGKRRIVPIHPDALAIFRTLDGEKDGAYVLQDDGNKILDRRLTRKFKDRLRQLDMDERLHFHSLRHSFATWLIQSRGASIYDVQKILGHATLKVTELYSQLLPETLRQTVSTIRIDIS